MIARWDEVVVYFQVQWCLMSRIAIMWGFADAVAACPYMKATLFSYLALILNSKFKAKKRKQLGW